MPSINVKIMRLKILIFCFFTSLGFTSCGLINDAFSNQSQNEREQQWKKIRNGLTKKQVIEILGEPNSTKHWSGNTEFTYECFTCTVTFGKTGKVWAWHSPSFR